jgi:hypothetical protein
MRVKQLIDYMFPDGTRANHNHTELYPIWPPDLFACSALIVDRSSAYIGLLSRDCKFRSKEKRRELREFAHCWQQKAWNEGHYHEQKAHLQSLWDSLVNCEAEMTNAASDNPARLEAWQEDALELMIIADIASSGIGFGFDGVVAGGDTEDQASTANGNGEENCNWLQKTAHLLMLQSSLAEAFDRQYQDLPSHLMQMSTICSPLVSKSIACVMPKTRTAVSGCTLRSASHNLALLPPSGVVRARWNPTPASSPGTVNHNSHSFNLLIIPIPYKIECKDFVDKGSLEMENLMEGEDGPRAGLFGMEQSWLPDNDDEAQQTAFCQFIINLIRQAQSNINKVDGVVFPELALNEPLYNKLVQLLLNEEDLDIEILVAGVFYPHKKDRNQFKNYAVTTVFGLDKDGEKDVFYSAPQPKHHRWKLDKGQITQYSLGDALNPELDWWEHANIRSREMHFFLIRQGACFTTLICEDLARADPGQQVIRSIGPNLVIALLMDGPQLASRWPGRYAMGLADDPGSSTLSVTSLGLINRSNNLHKTNSRTIALWRDPGGETRELDLPNNAKALLLTLTKRSTTEYTIDGRSDLHQAYQFILSGCNPVFCKDDTGHWAQER